MATIIPNANALGLAYPALGPWFSAAGLTLSAPQADLSVSLTVPAGGCDWLPPIAGVVSFLVATADRPRGLAHLRQASGQPAFASGNLVVLFTLLPEVEERMHRLAQSLPAADNNTPTPAAATRARVRYLALEFTGGPTTIGQLSPWILPQFDPADTVPKQATAIGLGADANGGLSNGQNPVAILRKPDKNPKPLLKGLPANTKLSLWAFDTAGRPIDPGAVAAWWNFLATAPFPNQLWADPNTPRTAPVANQLTIHLVNAHEGPVDAQLLAQRVSLTATTATANSAVLIGNQQGNVQGSVTPAPNAPATPDNAPVPLMALLPHATYGNQLTLWPSGPGNLTRDFVRVAVLDVEAHLVGQPRVAPANPTPAATRRAADQNRASTRVNVARTVAPALLATTDAASGAVLSVFTAAGGNAQLVTSVLEKSWGPSLAASFTPSAAPPNTPPSATDTPATLTVTALAGEGSLAGDGTISGQRVLVQCTFTPPQNQNYQGSWVRVWPQGFDPQTGNHTWLDGGTGVVGLNNQVSLVTLLPDGKADPTVPMGLHLLIVTAQGARLFSDVRFTRPSFAPGQPVAFANATNILLCETGAMGTPASLQGQVPSGATLVDIGVNPPRLVNPSSLLNADYSVNTLVRVVQAGDQIQLTQPAFVNLPAGDPVNTFTGLGAQVGQNTLTLLHQASNPGDPLVSMQRLEVVAANPQANLAAIATTPTVSRYHEQLPHQAGHPGVPAAPEIHGTGVSLNGPAAVLAAEYTRERVVGNTYNLANTAYNNVLNAPAPAAPSLWAAVLRTVGYGIESEINPDLLQTILGSNYPWGATLWQDIYNWVQTNLGYQLPGTAAAPPADIASMIRAIDRRMLAASQGAREGATSLLAAIHRAEDFIYIETPALDDLPFGAPNDQIQLVTALKQRMVDRPGLQVLLCLPNHLLPGMPSGMATARDELVRQALNSLRSGDPAILNTPRAARLAVFCPSAGPGRSLRLSATTVIVDDVYAMTGTTHLWCRGLSFDSSLAVSIFDEQLTEGRPTEVRKFRRQLIADRLGLAVGLVPVDPGELVSTIRKLTERGGAGRLAVETPTVPKDPPGNLDPWNPDGSPLSANNPLAWSNQFISSALSEITP